MRKKSRKNTVSETEQLTSGEYKLASQILETIKRCKEFSPRDAILIDISSKKLHRVLNSLMKKGYIWFWKREDENKIAIFPDLPLIHIKG